MGTLFDSVVTESKIWRGAARVLIAPSGTSFPGVLESVIQPKTPATGSHAVPYALGNAWTDIGGTSEDGVAITRGFEGEDGVAVDQLKAPLFEGDPRSWTMRVGLSMLETSYDKMAIAWELPTASVIAAGTGPDYNVAQHKALFSAPDTLTERLLAIVQQKPQSSGELRAFVFRKAKLAPEDSELAVQSGEASGLPVTFNCHADTTIDNDADQFGVMFEED